MRETTIASFVLRFVQEVPADTALPICSWRGLVRHVQSGNERPFTRIEDALDFISRYVDLGEWTQEEQRR